MSNFSGDYKCKMCSKNVKFYGKAHLNIVGSTEDWN